MIVKALRSLLSMIVFLSSFSPAFAEKITFKNETVIEGEVKNETEDVLVLVEKSADAFCENTYNLSEIKKIGERSLVEEGNITDQNKTKDQFAQAPVEVFECDAVYESAADKIADKVFQLKSFWGSRRDSYSVFQEESKKFSVLKNDFMKKYAKSNLLSKSYTVLLFQQVEDFFCYVNEVEFMEKKRQEMRQNNVTQKLISAVDQSIIEYTDLANEAMESANKYASMIKNKLSVL